ncbi:ABC transporter permease [Candidatus Thorarchaeota archaeon]|nr:MAG: ABC transporter permease [Candidatus Thorarchaeota archaeon]
MNETVIETSDTVKMLPKRKPIHVQIVSIGAFLLITLVLLVMIDLFIGVLVGNLSSSHAMLNTTQALIFINIVRATGIVCLVGSIWFGLLGKKLYLHTSGRVLQKILVLMICSLVYFALGIGIGLLITFGIYFWNPKQLVNLNKRQWMIYRYGIIGTILGVMFIELFFTNANIGFTILRPFFSVSLTTVLSPIGIAGFALVPAWFVIPLYLYLPKVIRDIWNQRPGIESFWKEFLYHPLGMIGLIIISTIILIAIFAPVLAPYYWRNPTTAPINLEELLRPPSSEHILGTNHRGEDIYSRLLYGSQISLIVGFAASVVAVFLGTAVGLISGYYGGIIDTLLMRLTDVFLCLPTLPLMLIFLVLFGQGLQNVIIVIAILGWTGTARMVRSEALSLRERPLTEAAHALGASDGYILVRHILPNTLPLILANMILGVVNAILSEAGIAFLGFVDIHGQPSWGIILHWAWKNAALLGNKWWWFIPPGLMIMLTTLGFVFISHTADKVVNPRLRGRRG